MLASVSKEVKRAAGIQQFGSAQLHFTTAVGGPRRLPEQLGWTSADGGT